VSAQKMLERVRGTLLRHGMAARGDTVVVGVSGGVDSVTLLDLLTRLGAEFDLKVFLLSAEGSVLQRIAKERTFRPRREGFGFGTTRRWRDDGVPAELRPAIIGTTIWRPF
jgi:hypothetical protein